MSLLLDIYLRDGDRLSVGPDYSPRKIKGEGSENTYAIKIILNTLILPGNRSSGGLAGWSIRAGSPEPAERQSRRSPSPSLASSPG
jgi:hypothetical protein